MLMVYSTIQKYSLCNTKSTPIMVVLVEQQWMIAALHRWMETMVIAAQISIAMCMIPAYAVS
jgi:hypothetical protein